MVPEKVHGKEQITTSCLNVISTGIQWQAESATGTALKLGKELLKLLTKKLTRQFVKG